MKHFFYLLTFVVCSLHAISQGQWSTLPVQGIRIDDVFFFDAQNGWAASNDSQRRIYQTSDGGNTWTAKFTQTTSYLRSITFASPLVGFCGSLSSKLYKTTDGGNTWIDIAGSISPVPSGICGLSAPTANVIYGCGIYASPAYVIKSADGGTT